MYHRAEMARVTAEMVRPDVSGGQWGGYDVEKMRIAGLARAIQSRLLLHVCSPKYCLQDRSTCRFFFPWPHQPHQCYDNNTERVALQRRVPEDDQWVNPHNLYLAMFSPATVHVLPFDPSHGADQARFYAAKYASKPEKWYYMTTERDGVKDFLKCRTLGLCMAHNRLLNFHVVRSTRPIQYIPAWFVPPKEHRTLRTPQHVRKNPEYPDPTYMINYTQKYFFRSKKLRHMRVEQVNRYFVLRADEQWCNTLEDTVDEVDCECVEADVYHRHFDSDAEHISAGSVLASTVPHLEGMRRRRSTRLGISRLPFIEPIGASREQFYEARLLAVLPWYCSEKPCEGVWTFRCDFPDVVDVPPATLKVGEGIAVSFEQICADLDKQFCGSCTPCACCSAEQDERCRACQYAVGFHRCCRAGVPEQIVWRKGSLHGGEVDIERAMFNLHRKGLPLNILREKADEYVAAQLLRSDKADRLIRVLQAERSVFSMANDDAEDVSDPHASFMLTPAQMAAELVDREKKMRCGAVAGGVTDQWRCYQYITDCIQRGEFLRLMVQASAGTGYYCIDYMYIECIRYCSHA